MPRAFGYVRQFFGWDEETVEAQRQSIRDHFESRLKPQGFTWGGLFEDAWTVGDRPFGSRPGGLRLGLEVDTGDVVVFSRLRAFGIGRDLIQVVGRWKERGVGAHFVADGLDTSTPKGESAIAAAASFEKMNRSERSERMKQSIAQRRSVGRPGSGPPPYGFKHTGKRGQRKLVDDPFTRKIGRFVVRQRLAGVGWETLYWYLFRAGQRRKDGKEWTVRTLQRMYDGEFRLLQKTAEGLAQLEEYKREGLEKARAHRRPDPETEAK